VKFLADECCDAALVDALRSDGYDVLYAVESLRGATDDELLTWSFSERRIFLTEDKDSCCSSSVRSRVAGMAVLWWRVKRKQKGV